ncbi:DNA internalization-related competence protein ComEC/Rec2 [Desulfoscipio geothermicus]|uniref:Competence protein ComEC n=1 Tax=Desulfoscipio geothermicus DSM 3669 TaxID=1121426 RepID=A0A1I6D1J1_9FIRM|nr:DNA internalization-related competence protein ComEC/Rec2 [Desulfoscipio geothermicus]SFQ99374.1 competence protein ComEC [Desulfoscipio geothermicus DSM 3669]
MGRPLLAMTLGFITGIVINSLFEVDSGVVLLLALAVFCVAVVGYILTWRENRRVFVLLFILLGWGTAAVDSARPPDGPERFAGHFVTLEGRVAAEPQVGKDNVRYLIQADIVAIGKHIVEVSGLVLVKAAKNERVYGYGDRLRLRGFLYIPGEPGNFGAFDYRSYLERRGIYCLMKVDGPRDVRLVGTGGGNAPVRLALRAKQALLKVAYETLDERQAAVISGVLFGSREGIDRATEDIFARSGVAHVLCVSGLHVGYVLAGTLLLAGALRMPRRAALLLVLPVLLFYAVMTGMGPAVQRAGIMAVLVLLAAQLGRERDWPTALALAALVILAIDPSSLYETGFQLSFAATWGILYLGPPLGKLLIKRWGMPRWLGLPLQVTVAAQLGTLPLLIYYFNLVTPVAPLANLLLVPLVGVIMLLGFAGCVVGSIYLPAAEPVNFGTGVLIDFFLWLAAQISMIPGGSAYVAAPPWYGVILWYAGLYLFVETVQGRLDLSRAGRYERFIPAATVPLLVLVIWWPWGGSGDQLRVHFIDVGQGDSILVQFPGGRTMLVDAGGRMGDPEGGQAVGESVVVPYLHRLGVNKLDVLAVTHPHGDHAGGALPVADKLHAGAVVITAASGYEELLAGLAPLQIPVYRVGAGQMLQIDDRVDVLVLGPGGKPAQEHEDLNDASLVLRLEYRDFSLLLTGDIEVEAQRALLAGGMELQSDVLKVPHHGSRFFTPGFFQAVAPEYAVIQVGRRNRFGHPAQETLDALENTGASIFRTDRDGAVLITSDGNKIVVKTGR